jgi:hypothetical protein
MKQEITNLNSVEFNNGALIVNGLSLKGNQIEEFINNLVEMAGKNETIVKKSLSDLTLERLTTNIKNASIDVEDFIQCFLSTCS